MTDEAFTWDQEQWGRVRQAIHDQAMRARVAASFLPLYGPLSSSAQTVPENRLADNALRVDDYSTLRLTTASVNVELGNAQIADPELASALIMFRRAASVVARVEDATIFRGQPGVDTLPSEALGKMTVQPRISGGGHYRGLLDYGIEKSPVSVGNIESGPEIFSGVVQAVSQLESCGYFGPYACVLGNKMFEAVNKPLKDSMVLPRDSILPYLNGPLLRSSTLPEECGVLVSLLGDPVEIVVGSDIAARYLQTTAEAKHVFRVSQRFVLRVKEPQAIAALMP